jgi:hypothetical protein
MAERHKSCEDCGLDFTTRYPHAKFCHLCRLLRDFKFLDKTGRAVKPCMLCDERYARITSHDKFCADCDDHPALIPGTCVICDDEVASLHHPTGPVCLRCLRHPDERLPIMRKLTQSRRWRIANPEQAQERADWQHACFVALKAGDEPPPNPISARAAVKQDALPEFSEDDAELEVEPLPEPTPAEPREAELGKYAANCAQCGRWFDTDNPHVKRCRNCPVELYVNAEPQVREPPEEPPELATVPPVPWIDTTNGPEPTIKPIAPGEDWYS